jgi:DNA-binding NarL/FixJ family response regulator
MALRLLLVEDHAAFRGALKLLLNLRPGMRVVAECGSIAGCRALGDRLGAVDLALLDLMLPDGDGAGLIALLRGANPEVRVLILSASIEPGLGERMAEAGADGVLDKTTALTGIVAEVVRLAGRRTRSSRGEDARQRRVALDAAQQSRIEALARSRGLSCGACGSRDLFSGEEALLGPDRGARVEMRCGRGAAHPGSAGGARLFAISPEEARRVGLGQGPDAPPRGAGRR